MNKVIFLDFDGPMIPVRAYFLPGQKDGESPNIPSVFDPVAVSLINRLIKISGAKLVISSLWRHKGFEEIKKVLEKNNMDPNHLHDDWRTPWKFTSQRYHEIKWWLDDHPEVTHYVAIDDTMLVLELVPNAVYVNTYDGFSFRDYLQSMLFLDAFDVELTDENIREEYEAQVDYMRRVEVEHVGYGNRRLSELLDLVEEMFPNKRSVWYKREEKQDAPV